MFWDVSSSPPTSHSKGIIWVNMAPPTPNIKVNSNGIPEFEDLPLRDGDPHHSAWGLYGDHDELGTLNRLTDERVAAAARNEVRTGQRLVISISKTNSGHICRPTVGG